MFSAVRWWVRELVIGVLEVVSELIQVNTSLVAGRSGLPASLLLGGRVSELPLLGVVALGWLDFPAAPGAHLAPGPPPLRAAPQPSELPPGGAGSSALPVLLPRKEVKPPLQPITACPRGLGSGLQRGRGPFSPHPRGHPLSSAHIPPLTGAG